jgi:type IV secretory pathway VirB3-like protein
LLIILFGILMLIIYLILLFMFKWFNKNDLNLIEYFKDKIENKLNIESFFNNKE